jgi:hypothetical protein
VELYPHSLNTNPWRGAQLKTQGQLYVYFAMRTYQLLNETLHHEDILGKWRYSSTHSKPRYYVEMRGHLHGHGDVSFSTH